MRIEAGGMWIPLWIHFVDTGVDTFVDTPGNALPESCSENAWIPLCIHFVDTGVDTFVDTSGNALPESCSENCVDTSVDTICGYRCGYSLWILLRSKKTAALSCAGAPSLDRRSSTRNLIQKRKGVKRTASNQKRRIDRAQGPETQRSSAF